jgi:hypothetical protein
MEDFDCYEDQDLYYEEYDQETWDDELPYDEEIEIPVLEPIIDEDVFFEDKLFPWLDDPGMEE